MASDETAAAPVGAGDGSTQESRLAGASGPRRSILKFVGDDASKQDDDDDEDDETDEEVSDDDDDDYDDAEDDSDTYIALPDGAVAEADIENPLVSRIGGPPAFLPLRTLPPYPATTLCPNAACTQPMDLLLQIFAPREQSPYDRCLHVWGCARRACNAPRASGSAASSSRPSLRVLRTLTYNPRWAAKLAKEKARQEEKAKVKAEQERAKQKQTGGDGKNPFALQSAGSAPSGGGMLFGGDSDDEEEDDDDADADQAERLAEELQIKATLEEQKRIRNESKRKAPTAGKDATSGPNEADDQIWPEPNETLAYRPAQYLNTIPEPWAAEEDEKAAAAKAAGALDNASGAGKGGSEGYERQLVSGITSTFERFVERVRREPTQVLRYAWDGTPLPYAQRLVVGSSSDSSAVIDSATKRAKVTTLDPPPCERCGAPRTFEVQLMPNLINLLKPSLLSAPTAPGTAAGTSATAKSALDVEAERADVGFTPLERAERARQREIARALGRAPTQDGSIAAASTTDSNAGARELVGLGWATAWVFVCSADCCRARGTGGGDRPTETGAEAEETWAEEWIAVEFEQL